MATGLSAIETISKRVAKHKREIASYEKQSIEMGGIPVERDKILKLNGAIDELLWVSKLIDKDSQETMSFQETMK